jgi:hypothetical protein
VPASEHKSRVTHADFSSVARFFERRPTPLAARSSRHSHEASRRQRATERRASTRALSALRAGARAHNAVASDKSAGVRGASELLESVHPSRG